MRALQESVVSPVDSTEELQQCVTAAHAAQAQLAQATPNQLCRAVRNMAQELRVRVDAVAAANQRDMGWAAERGLSEALVARLRFGVERAARRAAILDEIADLPSPLGGISNFRQLGNGLRAGKMRCPIGVIAMVYEARPHVTINAGALCLRTGNAAILKGGSEVNETNRLLGCLWKRALDAAGLPTTAVQVVTVPGPEFVDGLLTATDGVDLVIPRGGKGLIESVTQRASVPVVKHFKGNCHVYVDAGADIDEAVAICMDGKTLMPEVCNATESILVAGKIAPDFLVGLMRAMTSEGVEVRGCELTRQWLHGVNPATDEDWSTEYLDHVVSVKVVQDVDAAIAHINQYGSHHTDAICSQNAANIDQFISQVDSAVVLSNASTMFCDGRTLGMGAEIGISTDKLHARGPMGMEELTTYKWVIQGNGHTMGEES